MPSAYPVSQESKGWFPDIWRVVLKTALEAGDHETIRVLDTISGLWHFVWICRDQPNRQKPGVGREETGC